MSQRAPAGPKGHFLLGNAQDFSRDTLAFMLELPHYGDLVSIRFGPFVSFAANHPDLLHQVLVTDADRFRKDRIVRSALNEILGNGLFVSDGDFWKRQRKLVQPAFH